MIKKICGKVIDILLIAGFVWFVASYIDVVLHNIAPNPVYQWWNLFILLS